MKNFHNQNNWNNEIEENEVLSFHWEFGIRKNKKVADYETEFVNENELKWTYRIAGKKFQEKVACAIGFQDLRE